MLDFSVVTGVKYKINSKHCIYLTCYKLVKIRRNRLKIILELIIHSKTYPYLVDTEVINYIFS